MRLLAVPLLALGLAGIGSAPSAAAATGTQVADCNFATLQADLQAGGDYYYAAGQCPSPIPFTATITLGHDASLTAQGDDVTLDGGGRAGLFSVNFNVTFGLTGLTLAHGVGSNGTGGAVNSNGHLSITDSTFAHNSVTGSQSAGGAIESFSGTLTINRSTFADNSAAGGGALYYNGGTGAITNSTFSGNAATSGTFNDGGAVFVFGARVTVASSTFAGNSAGVGAGFYMYGGTLTIGSTILAGNSGGNCATGPNSSITDGDYNLADDSGCGFSTTDHDLVGQDPLFDPAGLQDNGGPTETIGLASNSPVIDAVPTSGGLCPATDQRGVTRPDGTETGCDIGAYESTYVDTTTSLTSSDNPSVVGEQVTYTATVNPAPDGGTVRFQDGGSDISGCGSQPVDSSGAATCQVTYPFHGTHTITVTYSGDRSYAISAAGPLTQTVVFSAPGPQHIADCSFATLQGDLQSGGDYYYTKGQCPDPIAFSQTIAIGQDASLTAQGDDIHLQSQNADSGATYRVQLFSVSGGATLGLTGLTLTDGTADSAGTGGGAIDNYGTVTVTDSTFSNNDDGQYPLYGGGAILNESDANLTITGSTFDSNVDSSVYTGNGGGAIYNSYGTVTITNSTLVDNRSGGPGVAINNQGTTVTLTNTTVSGNNYGYGGGKALYGGTYAISGSIIADNGAGNCSDNVTDNGYNLEDDSGASCGFSAANHDIVGQDPLLDSGGLQDNGGPTRTVALQYSSPAIDDIPTSSSQCPATDQRGKPRLDEDETSCDIGAYEYQDPATVPTTTTLSSSANPSVVGQQVTYTAAVSPTPGGGTVAFQDGGSVITGCGAVSVDASSGTATCQVTYGGAGSHSITAKYGGDTHHRGSTSDTLTQTVQKIATTTSLSSSANPSVASQQVTYTAAVVPVPDGGTVEFKQASKDISGCTSVPVDTSTGKATCQVTYVTAGSHPVNAIYSGDSSYAGSTSNTLQQQVKSDLKTTLTLSPNPVARGGTLTIKGSVTNLGTTSERIALSYTITDPNGATTTFTLGTVTADSGMTVTRTTTYPVAGNAPTGRYTVTWTATDRTGRSRSTRHDTVV